MHTSRLNQASRCLSLIAFVLIVCGEVHARTADITQDAARPAPAPAATQSAQEVVTPAPTPITSGDASAAPAPQASSAVGETEEPPATDAAPASPPSAPAQATPTPTPTPTPPCTGANAKTVKANVVALAQPYMLNRLGASMPNALIFALESDVDLNTGQLKPTKRARPLVLRVNAGDCLEVTLNNLIKPYTSTVPGTTQVSLHIEGMQLQATDGDGTPAGINNDGSFVGVNKSSLVALGAKRKYKLYAQKEGTYLLYSMGDPNTNGQQIELGLFGAVNVEPPTAEWYRSQITAEDLKLATKKDAGGNPIQTAGGQPVIDYNAVYPATHPRAGKPILKMLDAQSNIVYSDLTAVITGPNAGRFAGVNGPNTPDPPCSLLDDPNNTTQVNPLFCVNPSTPDRKQPYREVTVIYHEVMNAAQAFPVFTDPDLGATVDPGQDLFAINYGSGGRSATRR
jgi:manganese oxidase